MDIVPAIALGSLCVVCGYVCFRKGKPVFGWLSVAGAVPFLWYLGVFGIVGAARYAKPNSPWAEKNYSPTQLVIARRRFPLQAAASQPSRAAFPGESSDRLYVVARFLEKAARDGVIDLDTRRRLIEYLERGEASPVAEPPTRGVAAEGAPPTAVVPETPPTPEPAPETITRGPSRQVEKPPPESPTPETPSIAVPSPALEPRAPGRTSALLTRAWEAFVSDVALHGFAYLGVVLTFVGVLGFLLFAFADLHDAVQPFVELFIAFIFFGWSWMLRRQDAYRVANGMELIGGMVFPLIFFAGLVDNAPFPPDFSGSALIVALTVCSVLIAGVYAWISARNPESTLRFLVAPLLWLGAMTLGFAFKTDEFLASEAITRLVSPQPALAASAVSLTLVAALAKRRHRLAEPTVRSALVGAPVAYLLTVALAVGEGWSRDWPIVLLGAATLVSAEAVARWFQRLDWMAVGRPVLLAGVLAPLTPSLGVGWTGLLALGAYLVLDEYHHRADRDPVTGSWLTLTGVAIGLLMTVEQPIAALLGFSIATVWAHYRRVADQGSTWRVLFTTAAASLPLGVVWALGELFGLGTAWLIMAAVVAGLALIVRWKAIPDTFWTYWILGALSIIALGSAGAWVLLGSDGVDVASTLAVVATGLILGKEWPVLRLWLAAGAAAAALAISLSAYEVPAGTRVTVWAITGLSLVIAAVAWRGGRAEHLAAIGHITATAAVCSLVAVGEPYVALGAWALGWTASALAGELDGKTLTTLLDRLVGSPGSWLAPVLAVVSIPPALVVNANQWSQFADNRSWTGMLMATVGVAYVLVSRASGLGYQLRRSLAVAAVVASIIGVSVAAPESWPTIYAAVASIVVAGLLSRDFRQSWFVWFAWLMTVVIALMLGDLAGVPGSSLHLVGVVWGGIMLVGGVVVDDVRSGRRSVGEGLRSPWLRYPVLLGALVVPVSLGPVFVGDPRYYGWWALGAAAGYFTIAWLLRAGSVSAPGYGLAALGVTALLQRQLLDDPWLFVLVAAPLVGISWISERVQSDVYTGWMRWDLAPLVVAHGVAMVALVLAVANGGLASTAFAFGLLSISVGLWRRSRVWEDLGNVLIVIAGWELGAGWLTAALAATSARGIVRARLADGLGRASYHAMATVGLALSWLSGVVWLEVDPVTGVNASVMFFAAIAVSIALTDRLGNVRSDTTAWWGGLALLGTAVVAFYALGLGEDRIVGPWFSISLSALAIAFEIVADAYDPRLFKAVSVVLVGLSWAALLDGLGWGAPEAYDYSALVFGGFALVAAMAGRVGLFRAGTAQRWGALGVAGVLIATLASLDPEGGVLFDGPEMAIGLGMTALALEAGATFNHRSVRFVAIPISGTAWVALALGLTWDHDFSTVATAIVFGLLAVATGEYVRSRRVVGDMGLARGWAALGGIGVVAAAIMSIGASNLGATGFWVAGALALLAVAAARGASPYEAGFLRDLAGISALASALVLASAAGWPEVTIAAGVLIVAAASTFVALSLWRRRPESPWVRSLSILGGVANAVTAALALGQLPDRTLLIGVLLTVGAQSIAIGLIRAMPAVLALGPPLLAVAFVLLAGESFQGSAQWYTVPLGVVILSEVEILGTLPRFAGPAGDRSVLVVLEWIGLGVLAAPPLVEMFTVSLFAGLLALGAAAAVFVWGVATRVRRRVVAAASLAVATMVLMLTAAAAGSTPDSAFFWIVAAGIGFTVMTVAGLVEAYRSKKGRTMARLDQLMVGWE